MFARIAVDGTSIAEIEVAAGAAPVRPEMAWEGTGFTLAWRRTVTVMPSGVSILHYAHIAVCQ